MKMKIKRFVKPINILLLLILLFAFVARVYRIDQLLGFYYDQGRDALVIWDFWRHGKFFLIGPTTGIEGVFRGPWYYWLIAPFYLMGKGNPVWPSIFLSLTTVAAVFLSYKIAEKIAGKWAGILAAVIGGFSHSLVLSSRWLSNPTPMFLISMLFIYSFLLILEGKRWAWIFASFMAGMAMQFGSAAEVFYFGGIGVFLVYLLFTDKKKLPDIKSIIFSAFAFGITITPQVLFDLRHDGILRGTISRFLFQQGSFKLSFWEIAKIRFPFYYDVFFSKLFSTYTKAKEIFAVILGGLFLYNIKAILKNKLLVVLLIFLLSPIIGMLFFQGNFGNVYDYYFTGYYLIFVLFFAGVLGLSSKSLWGKVVILSFLAIFLLDNPPSIKSYITSGFGETTVALGSEKKAVEWVFDDAKGRPFNLDVYVPPVIPYAYDYLSVWIGAQRCGEDLCGLTKNGELPLLYTLFEVDVEHPERLEAWTKRQAGIGKIDEEVHFGGVGVDRRERTLYEKKR
jgi:4-amino-4-deoxy-L-arabinose transferase-like glycosyltransferase